MSYIVYIDTIRAPVAPESISIKMKSRNEQIELADQYIFTHLKSPELTEISFDLLLPAHEYPFAVYAMNRYTTSTAFHKASWFINKWQALMKNKQACRLYILRGTKKVSSDATYLPVTIESMTTKEDADGRGDIEVSMTLKKYVDNATKTLTFDSNNNYTISVTRSLITSDNIGTKTVPNDTAKGWEYLVKLGKMYRLPTAYSGLYDISAGVSIFNANRDKIVSAAKAHYYAYMKQTYKTASEGKIKEKNKYSEEQWLQEQKKLHARADYKCWMQLRRDNDNNVWAKKLYKSYIYLVKGTVLTMPNTLLSKNL